MRMILFAGKGGTGKTSLAAATAALAAAAGKRTLVISLDPAHSLSDAFDRPVDLLAQAGQPARVAENLWLQEINVGQAIKEYWADVHAYLSLLLNTTGLDQVVAEEIAILPGMEEISALLYINGYLKERAYDLLVLDCAPTAESIRFVAIPTALKWYMSRLFKMERTMAKLIRPIASRLTDLPLPGDDYFACLERLSAGLGGVDEMLTDHTVTSVRLVTNPEKMVLKETQRAFMYFSLHGLMVESVIINRVWPQGDLGALSGYAASQAGYIEQAESYFGGVTLLRAPLQQREVLGHGRLVDLGRQVYGERDVTGFMRADPPVSFSKTGGRMVVSLHLPFVAKGEVELNKVGDELVVEVGMVRRHLSLPASFAGAAPSRASFNGDRLEIEFNPAPEG